MKCIQIALLKLRIEIEIEASAQIKINELFKRKHQCTALGIHWARASHTNDMSNVESHIKIIIAKKWFEMMIVVWNSNQNTFTPQIQWVALKGHGYTFYVAIWNS